MGGVNMGGVNTTIKNVFEGDGGWELPSLYQILNRSVNCLKVQSSIFSFNLAAYFSIARFPVIYRLKKETEI